jgi:lambda repressor-like predicted transcriptional regulator
MTNASADHRRAALLREFEMSGLSMAAFCRSRDVGYSTLALWRRVARGKTDPPARFVEIEPAVAGPEPRPLSPGREPAERSPLTGALLAELPLPGGAVLRVFQCSGLWASSGKGGPS